MKMPGKVQIEALEVHAYHGWHAHEGEFGQHFTVDIELETDIGRAAESDELVHAIDYAAIVGAARRLFVEKRYKLVEAAAAALASGLLREFPSVEAARVRVRKLKPPIPERLSSVGVEVSLSRKDLAS